MLSRPAKRSSHRRLQSLTTFTTYATAVALVASVVSVGYQSPIEQNRSNQDGEQSAMQLSAPSVDQLQAAELAASTAQVANLSVASSVSNLSISLAAKSQLAQTSDTVLSKPEIVQTGTGHRGITDYTVVAGDNAQTVADKFSITKQTLKWSNNIANDALTPGTQMLIPGVNGVIYTVKDGDSIDGIASKYSSIKERIVTYNDLETSGLVAGQKIVLPDGILPTNERPETQRAAPAARPTFGYAYSAAAGNRYDYGYCTWYAYNRRAQLGRPVGGMWGNAYSWDYFAQQAGYLVDNTPEVGAVMQTDAGRWGHVAVVESIGPDGSVTVSEMNYGGQWNRVTYRTLDPGQAAGYKYIH